jgi:mono/diheme cytochrome c family protein
VILGGASLALVEFGLFDTTAETPHQPLVAWAAHETFIRFTKRHASAAPEPPPLTPQSIQAGLRIYDRDCAVCHGAPGVSRPKWVSGMEPTPPYLLSAARRWDRRQLYWIIARGVKMTAMPAWDETRPSSEIWDVVAFLDALPYLSTRDYLAMRRAQQAPGRRDPGSPAAQAPGIDGGGRR